MYGFIVKACITQPLAITILNKQVLLITFSFIYIPSQQTVVLYFMRNGNYSYVLFASFKNTLHVATASVLYFLLK